MSREDLSQILDTHPRTLSRLLKHQPHPTDKGWHVIDVLDDEGKLDPQAYYLSQFIPRLRYWYLQPEPESPPKRQGFILEVAIDDPLVEEDEAQLRRLQVEEIQSILGSPMFALPTGQNVTSGSPNIDISMPTGQNVTSGILPTGQNVTSGIFAPFLGPENPLPTGQNVTSGSPNIDISMPTGQNVPITLTFNELTKSIEILDKHIESKRTLREALTPVVQVAEGLLNDYHSTRMFYKVLQALYPDHLKLFLQAMGEALAVGEYDAGANLGALFVTGVKGLAVEAGVDLGLEGGGALKGAGPGSEDPFPEARAASYQIGLPGAGPPEMDMGEDLWDMVLTELRLQMTKATFDTWLRSTALLRREEKWVVVGVPNGYVKEWLEHRLAPTVQRTLASLLGQPIQVAFEVVGER